MKNKTTHYQIILDKSGSMQDCVDSTISGFNEQMDVIRSLQREYPDQEITVSLTIFNQKIKKALSFAKPGEVPNLSQETYQPDGMTALLDAVGESVTSLRSQVEQEIANDRATAVVVVITDGYENSSREYSHRQISKMIKELEATDNWTFSYIGATLDAVEVAGRMNIGVQNSMSYMKEDTRDMHGQMSRSMRDYIDHKARGFKKKDFIVRDEDEDKK